MYINKLLKTEDIDYVIAIDTDSIYVTFDRLVDNVFQEGATTTKIVTFLDKICKDKVEPYINLCYKNLHSYVNSYE